VIKYSVVNVLDVGVLMMTYKILLASIASRKAIGMMYSLKEVIKAKIIGVSHRVHHPHNYSKLLDEKHIVKVDREKAAWALAVAKLARNVAADLVVPVDFIDVATFSKYIKIFDEFEVKVAAPSYEAVAKASSKGDLPKTLKGIAEVPSLVIVKGSENVNLIRDLKPPLVVKGLGDASKPEYVISHELAAEMALKRAPCLVQEYAPGRARGYYVVAYEGTPLLEFTHERIVEYDPSGGASLAAKGPMMDPNLYALGRAVVRHLRWSGPLMVETKWNYELGKYYVIELNPKFWGSLHLSVSLGYHFPAILALAYLEGVESAEKLAKTLKVLKGEYYWVVDGLRYLAKVPTTWLYMARKGLLGFGFSDFHLSDPTRLVPQLLVGLSSLKSEKIRWRKSVEKSLSSLSRWFQSLCSRLMRSKKRPLFIFDLDGTLVDFNINWILVKRALIKANLAFKWESVSAALSRLWMNNVEDFYRASSVIESFELNSIRYVKLLVNEVDYLRKLASEAYICLATKQSVKSASKALEKVGLTSIFHYVVGRDSGFGPLKESLFQACMSRFNYGSDDPIIVVEDNLINVITAIRVGAHPIRVAKNSYKLFQSLRLGLPSTRPKELPKIIGLICKFAKRSSCFGKKDFMMCRFS